tara:strand:- start:515 stop:1090 length:576 start_codon:yes stop_codon:yes gene_type:complete
VDAENLDEKAQRIIAAAFELAQTGGFEAVRLRDVAARSGVALGTLYKRFRSKEDILVGALELLAQRYEEGDLTHHIEGSNAEDRVVTLLTTLTEAMFSSPNFAKALLRAVASGVPSVAEKVGAYRGRMTGLILQSMEVQGDDERGMRVAIILQHVWFAAMVGWMSGLRDEEGIIEELRPTVQLLLEGSNAA